MYLHCHYHHQLHSYHTVDLLDLAPSLITCPSAVVSWILVPSATVLPPAVDVFV